MAESDGLMSVVVYFYGSDRTAFQALLALQRIEREHGLKTVGVADAAVMSEAEERGKLKIDRTIEFREGTEGQLGIIFAPSVLAQRAVGRGALSVAEHFTTLGFKVNLLKEIGENLPPDGAALVVVVEEPWLDELRKAAGEFADLDRYALDPEAAALLAEHSPPEAS
jgi:uncharacterized membrane protein